MIKHFLIVIILITCSISMSGCIKKDEPQLPQFEYPKVRLSLTTSGTEKSINTLTAKKFAEMVEKESNGNIKIDVYINEELAGGNTTKGVTMLADGSIDMAFYTSGTFSTINPKISAVTLPWLFKNYQQVRITMDKKGSKFYEKILAQEGIIFLGYIHNGFRQISNNKCMIKTPDDLAGMKIRVLGNEGYSLFFKMFDAKPIPMSKSEMSLALSKGTIDGHDMGLFQSGTDKLNEVEKYITVCNYAYETYIFAINSKTFSSLDKRTQEMLRWKARVACDWGRDWLERNEQFFRRKFLEQGVIISELSNEELESFKERIQPLIEDMKQKYGKEACLAFGIE